MKRLARTKQCGRTVMSKRQAPRGAIDGNESGGRHELWSNLGLGHLLKPEGSRSAESDNEEPPSKRPRCVSDDEEDGDGDSSDESDVEGHVKQFRLNFSHNDDVV